MNLTLILICQYHLFEGLQPFFDTGIHFLSICAILWEKRFFRRLLLALTFFVANSGCRHYALFESSIWGTLWFEILATILYIILGGSFDVGCSTLAKASLAVINLFRVLIIANIFIYRNAWSVINLILRRNSIGLFKLLDLESFFIIYRIVINISVGQETESGISLVEEISWFETSMKISIISVTLADILRNGLASKGFEVQDLILLSNVSIR